MSARNKINRRRIMREFTIKELGAVDRPAQSHALAVLMKRADADEDADKSYGDAPQPLAASSEIQAIDFDDVLAEQEAHEAASEVGEELREKWCALQRSFATIAGDESISAADKITAMQASLQQYIDSLSEQSQTIADEMTKFLTAAPALADLLHSKGEVPMTDAEKKQIADLQKTVEELNKKLEAATTKDTAKKAADLTAELDAAKAQIDELSKKIEADKVEKSEAIAKASMSDAEKAHMASLSGDKKAQFMQASPADRAKMMAKAAEGDEVVKVGGREIRKSVVGEDQFAVIKFQQEEIAKQADAITKANEARENAELAKRADEDPYKSFSVEKAVGGAKATSKIDVIRAIAKMDEGPRAVLEKWLTIGAKAVASAFNTIGHAHEQLHKSAADFEKRVTEVQSRDKSTRLAALEKAQREFPEEFKAYQASGVRAN